MNKYKIIRTYNDQNDLGFTIEFPEGKSISDIEDVIFLVKEKDSDPLAEALITKLYSNSEITLHNLDVAKVKFSLSDYDNIEIGNLYEAALFCKWTGDPDFDEYVERLFDFQCVQNFHNNN